MKDNSDGAAISTIFKGPSHVAPREAPFLALSSNMAASSTSVHNLMVNPPNTYTQTP